MNVTKWEYKALDSSKRNFEETINSLGQDGWEAVAIDGICLLKRPCGRIHVEEVVVDPNHSNQFSQTVLNYDDVMSR